MPKSHSPNESLRFVGFVGLEALQQKQNMHYAMVIPEPIKADCG